MRSVEATNSNERPAISVNTFRVNPIGSQLPIGSLPSAGGMARGPKDGLYDSYTLRPAGVSSAATSPRFAEPFVRIQTPDRSRGLSVPVGLAHPLGRCH